MSAAVMSGRAQASRGHQRPRPGPKPRPGSAVSRRRQRPVTAPHGAQTRFTGSRSGGHQGERAARRGEDGFSCSSSRWQNNSRASTRNESNSIQGSMTITVKEMPSNMGMRGEGSQGLCVAGLPKRRSSPWRISTASMPSERKMSSVGKKGGSRHENWFSKPHVASPGSPTLVERFQELFLRSQTGTDSWPRREK